MSRLNSTLKQSRLHQLLDYSTETGIFVRKQKTGNAQRIGEVVGSVTKTGYCKINVDMMSYRAHHLAWFYVYGEFPQGWVEHIDGNTLNNRISNLRILVKDKSEPTQEFLKTVLTYDASSGIFRWKKPLSRYGKVGDIAGSIVKDGYWRIGINGKAHKAHRLAWLYVYGDWPKVIDHIDGDRLNNRIDNLRDTTRSVNCQNLRHASKANKSSGLLGVSRFKSGTYSASIRLGDRSFHLGSFKNPEEAHEAYLKAKRELHPGCTI